MILAGKDILKRIKKGEIKIEPFVKNQLEPASYDLRLHRNFRIFKRSVITHIDVKEKSDATELVKVKKGGVFVIHPGEFVLASTYEKIGMPSDLVGMLEGRSSLGRLGLIVHATASHVKPGFSGYLTFEMTNLSNIPVKLYAGMCVAQISFHELSSPVEKKYLKSGSRYQDQEPPTASMIWKDFLK